MNSHESIIELDMTVDELLVQLAGVRKRKLELAAEIKVCGCTASAEIPKHTTAMTPSSPLPLLTLPPGVA